MIIFKILKNALLFILREIASFAVKTLIVIFVLVGLFVYFGGTQQKKITPLKTDSYLELNVASEIGEKGGINLFAREGENLNFYNLLKILDSAKGDGRIKGIILKTDSVGLNRAQIDELREKLDEVKKSGKIVYSFSRVLDNRTYSLAVGANEIIMPPSRGSGVDIKGYYTESRYMKRLTDKVGIKYNVIHVGDYKAYGENYVRESMSPERREDLTRILDKIYYEFVERVAKRRNIPKTILNRKILEGEFVLADSFKMKEERLIDSLEYYHEFLENRGIENVISMGEYTKYISDKSTSKEKIAVVYGEGNILYSAAKSPKTIITPDVLIKELDMAGDDPDIKGIVLRVDSPGGSALASEVINAKMKEIGKPIFISMGGTAASGGYYISSAGERIYASRGTITGSIGVVSIIPNFSEISDKLGVNTEVIQKGELAGIYSLFNEMTPKERERVYQSSLGVYEEFKERVSSGRGIDSETLETLAGGRVWLGEEAVENGLVDEIGGIEDTIKGMADYLEIEDYTVVEVKSEKPFERFFMNYARVMGIYNKIRAVVEVDEKAMVEENELLIRPVMYLPYNI